MLCRFPAERKPSPTIDHWFYAIGAGERWVAMYQSPGLGLRYVRNENGTPEQYPTKQKAETAAAYALVEALNKTAAPIRATKEVIPPKRRRAQKSW